MSTASANNMSYIDTFKKVHPYEFNRRFLSRGVRTDGRELLQYRTTGIEMDCFATSNNGNDNSENNNNKNKGANGKGKSLQLSNIANLASSVVRQGNTSVVCTIKGHFVNPSQEVSYNFSNICASNICDDDDVITDSE